MKLKKLFLAKNIVLPIASAVLLFASCSSSNFSVPVPGQGDAKINNIYVEYYNLGESYYKLEDYKKAAEYYELAMKKKEQYWAAYYKLAKCYVFISDWNNALPMYKKILERDSENASLKASLAYIYSMQGNFKNAKMVYLELLQEQPNNLDYLENYLAVLLADEKKLKKEKESFDKYFEILKTEYPESKNITTFEEKYKKLLDIKDEVTDDEDTDDEGASETTESDISEDSKNSKA